IIETLRAVDGVRGRDTRLHLLGVTRTDALPTFCELGAASFDSTSPLRQAFKDERDNYYAYGRTYTAIRVPQVEGNVALQKRIRAGQVSQPKARMLESGCMRLLREYDAGQATADDVAAQLGEYERLHGLTGGASENYRETLEDRPWKECPCEVCS